jgi:hypothetical protein
MMHSHVETKREPRRPVAKHFDSEPWTLLMSLPPEAHGLQHKPEHYYLRSYFHSSRQTEQLPISGLANAISAVFEIKSSEIAAVSRFVSEAIRRTRQDVSAAVLTRRVRDLSRELHVLTRKHEHLLTRVTRLEGQGVTTVTPNVPIDWGSVAQVVERAANDFGLTPSIEIDSEDRLLVIKVPAEQEDLLANVTLSLYDNILTAIGQDAFDSLNFDFDIL